MKVLIIHCLPNLTSFSRILKNAFVRGLEEKNHQIEEIDLIQKQFDVNLYIPNRNPEDLTVYHQKIRNADVLVFVYPNWWNNMPALMKGFIDRVFTTDFAFRYDEGKPEGLLTHLKCVYLISSMAVSFWSEFFNINGARSFYSNFKGIMNFCGIGDVRRIQAYGITANGDNKKAQQYIEDAKKAGRNLPA